MALEHYKIRDILVRQLEKKGPLTILDAVNTVDRRTTATSRDEIRHAIYHGLETGTRLQLGPDLKIHRYLEGIKSKKRDQIMRGNDESCPTCGGDGFIFKGRKPCPDCNEEYWESEEGA